ncbi:MAG: hypothetical protein ACYTHK_00800 [Planctomycetota bacterium]
MIEFLEAGQDQIPRNRKLTFRFSAPVMEGQDLYTRLRIQNIIQEQPNPNFARSRGLYFVNGDVVEFLPRLPQLPDRSDAGFLENGSYHVYLSGGPDGLQSTSGDTIPTQQEFVFETNIYFEDIIPSEPPRAIEMLAIDKTDDSFTDISRLDPRPAELAKLDNATLIANDRVIDPGAGGPPDYEVPWSIELQVSEPLDPASITNRSVEMYEIYSGAFDQPDNEASAGWFGNPVNFRVAIFVSAVQSIDAEGNYDTRIRIVPQQTLVDDTRYRITVSGEVLGLDFRNTFAGDNGLTGDGMTMVDGTEYPEPGGLGYVTEFLVFDRDAINATRPLLFDPQEDGIQPELGQTTLDPEEGINSALYNPSTNPGTAVGFLSAFGQGTDGPYAVSGGNTVVLNTGDIPNEPLGNPFQVLDINPDNLYDEDTRPGRMVEWDSPESFELELESLTVSSSSTLRIEGANPIMFRVQGIVDISGKIDVAGSDGNNAGPNGMGGVGGAGGFDGGDSNRPTGNCTRTWGCVNFSNFLNGCNNSFPNSLNGEGPGRGYAGAEIYNYDYSDDRNGSATGTGGGGAGHGEPGGIGEDRRNAGGAPGTPGNACSTIGGIKNSSVIGVRGMGGQAYGDREIIDVTLGGSGGGGGGSTHAWGQNAKQQSGGGGGGGGGSIAIISAGPIIAIGGQIDATGGDGGKGNIQFGGSSNWYSVAGGGGGGGGGTIALISGDKITLTGGIVDASGGAGGPRADNVAGSCDGCNAGGDGGNGFIFMMDADGEIEGHIPNRPGEYDTHSRGILTISKFDATRFSSITAVTELFPMTAANPAYQNYDQDVEGYLPPDNEDVKAFVNTGQRIRVLVSSAKSSPEDPVSPDLFSETTPFEVAMVEYRNGATAVKITGEMRDLNQIPGAPDREAFVRVQAEFFYDDDPVQAALGPFCFIEQVLVNYDFNG